MRSARATGRNAARGSDETVGRASAWPLPIQELHERRILDLRVVPAIDRNSIDDDDVVEPGPGEACGEIGADRPGVLLDFGGLKGEWTIKATGEADNRETNLEVGIKDVGDKTLVHMKILGLEYDLEPLALKQSDQTAPPKSGGLITALYLYRQLLVYGPKGFVGEFSHGGQERFCASSASLQSRS